MFEDNFAEVNGLRLHYVSAGTGRLILFVHGFPEFWYAWKAQLAEFSRDHQAAAPDMRGYNLSGKPAAVEQYRVKYLVEDIRALARHLGHEKFTLVAHDWGGAAAWMFAVAYPQQLERLVIINSPHPAIFARELQHNPAQQQASAYMLALQSPQAEARLSAENFALLRDLAFGEGFGRAFFTEADRRAYLEAWSQPGALTGGLNYYRASRLGPPEGGETGAEASFSRNPASLAVRVPTLVIWGEKDTALLTGNLNGLEQFVPRLTVKRIPNGSHWVIHEQPALVNALIREFLNAP